MNHERSYRVRRASRGAGRAGALAAVIGVALVSSACQMRATARPAVPAVATFKVGNETFRALLRTEAQVNAAVAAMQGGAARIPNGRVVEGAGLNSGYTWHLEDVQFAEATLDSCNGRPSDVERHGVGFGRGRFCPWRAEVIAVQTWR
jgi:hypothetical protein